MDLLSRSFGNAKQRRLPVAVPAAVGHDGTAHDDRGRAAAPCLVVVGFPRLNRREAVRAVVCEAAGGVGVVVVVGRGFGDALLRGGFALEAPVADQEVDDKGGNCADDN